MATIEIYRHWGYLGAVRALKVWIDGVPVGYIRTRRTELFNVSDATHSIRVSMDWCKSVPLEVDLSNGGTTALIAKTLWMPASAFLVFIRPSIVFSIIPKRI